ncbi:EpsG family protein [Streptococcus sp. FSL R7-0212]|uniref:EpsG family protein n=1 Tax=Streptococcus sp. FSL R7-0212 TaxID=2921726 RepID=UPI0030F74084
MISTIIIYNGLLLYCLIFSYLATNSKNKASRNISLFFVFLGLFLTAALRKGVGADFETYQNIFNNINIYNFHTLEPIFLIVNKALKTIGFTSQSIFVFMAFVNSIFIVLSCNKVKYPEIFIFLYYVYFYLNSLNAMRQETAVCILIYAILVLFEGNIKEYILLVLLATGFHYVSILFLPFILFNKLKYNKRTFFIGIILSILFFRISLVQILAQTGILAGTKYQFYLNLDIYNKATEIGSGIGMVLRYFILIPIFFVKKSYFKIDNLKKRNIIMLLNIILIISIIISLKFYIFHRFVTLFSVSLIYSIMLVLDSKSRWRQVIVTIALVFSLLFFEIDIVNSQKAVPGNKGVTPYVSILSER